MKGTRSEPSVRRTSRTVRAALSLAVGISMFGGMTAAHANEYEPLMLVDLQNNRWMTAKLDLGGAPTTSIQFQVQSSIMDCPVYLAYELWTGPVESPTFLVGVSHNYAHGDYGVTVRREDTEVANVTHHGGCASSFFGVRLNPRAEMVQGGPLYLAIYRSGGPVNMTINMKHRATENVSVVGTREGTGVHYVTGDEFSQGADSAYVYGQTGASAFVPPVFLGGASGTIEYMRNLSYQLTFDNPARLTAVGPSDDCSLTLRNAEGVLQEGQFVSSYRTLPPGTYTVQVNDCRNAGISGRFTLTAADYSFP